MKPFKSTFESKSERKKAFSGILSQLITDNEVTVDEDDIIRLAPVKTEKVHKDKKNKKRKLSDAEEIPADNVVSPEPETVAAPEPKVYPIPTGNTTILLFYAYCTPQMTRGVLPFISFKVTFQWHSQLFLTFRRAGRGDRLLLQDAQRARHDR